MIKLDQKRGERKKIMMKRRLLPDALDPKRAYTLRKDSALTII
jgi:hypothetical protein